MPDNEVYGFDASTTARIADAVREIEQARGIPGPRPFSRDYSNTAAVEIVRVTSTTQVNSEYPGRVQKIDPHTTPPGITDLNTYDDCWIVGPNAETLTAQKYVARMDGDGNTPVRPRFLICGAVGGSSGPASSVVLRVPTAGSGLVAANVQTWTDTGGAPSRVDGASAWVFDQNANAINAQYYNGTFAVNHSDGNAIYSVMSGFTGVESICLGDGQYHTFTWAGGDLVSVV